MTVLQCCYVFRTLISVKPGSIVLNHHLIRVNFSENPNTMLGKLLVFSLLIAVINAHAIPMNIAQIPKEIRGKLLLLIGKDQN